MKATPILTRKKKNQKDEEANDQESRGQVGKAGDALPAFKNHMIRQRVTRHGIIFPLPPASELPGCTMDRELVGVAKQGPVKKWLEKRQQWDRRFASSKRKIHKQFVQDLAVGYEGFGTGEFPPPSALAGRRKKQGATKTRKRTKSMGLALWSLWGSKHDKMTMDREMEADRADRTIEVRPSSAVEGLGARSFGEIERQGTVAPASPLASPPAQDPDRSRSRRRRVTYQMQDEDVDENTPAAELLAHRQQQEGSGAAAAAAMDTPQLLTPGYQPEVGTGSTGKRAYVDGIAVPFSLKKEAETASMMTLTSDVSQGPQSPRASTTSRPMSSTTAEHSTGVEYEARGSSEANGNGNGNDITAA